MRKDLFWDDKIISWERRRYESSGFASTSVKARMDLARQFLKESRTALGPVILDLGCGSGRLFADLDGVFSEMIGMDFSGVAVDSARETSPRMHFIHGNAVTDPWPSQATCVTGLGIFDWLNDSEIEQVAAKLNGRPFLFSISEKKPDLRIFLHAMYIRCAQSVSTWKYRPAYQRVRDLSEMFKHAGYSKIYSLRDSRLRFGTLLSNLPFPAGLGVS